MNIRYLRKIEELRGYKRKTKEKVSRMKGLGENYGRRERKCVLSLRYKKKNIALMKQY